MITLSNMLLGKASKKCAVLYLIQYEIDWFKMCWNFRSWVILINSGHKQFGLREKQSREGSFLHSRSEATLCFGHVIFTFHGPCGKWDFQMKLGSVRCCQEHCTTESLQGWTWVAERRNVHLETLNYTILVSFVESHATATENEVRDVMSKYLKYAAGRRGGGGRKIIHE